MRYAIVGKKKNILIAYDQEAKDLFENMKRRGAVREIPLDPTPYKNDLGDFVYETPLLMVKSDNAGFTSETVLSIAR